MKRFTQFISIVVLQILITAQGALAKNSCESLFENKTHLKKITSLVIKDAKPKAPPKHWGLTTPFKTLEENLLDKPTRFVSQKWMGKKKELGPLLKIPLIAILSIAAWQNIDRHIFWPMAEQRATEQILDATERNVAYYDKLIATDFRFKDIRDIKDKGITSPEVGILSPTVNARVLAYGLKKSYENYFNTYSQIKNSEVLTMQENITSFGSNPLFEHLNFFFENGVKQFEGTYVPPQYQGPLSDGQKKTLFDLTHLLYTKYLLIDVLFDEKTNVDLLVAKNNLARDLYYDSYSKKLMTLYKEGKISKDNLIYFLQEDAHHAYYMSLFKTLHIVNLKSENGKYTNEPLTLQDLRESRLSTL